MAQDVVARGVQGPDTAEPVQWKSRRWGKASHAIACAGLICSILVLSATWNGIQVFVYPHESISVAEAKIDLMGMYLALLALAVFLLGCGVVGYMYRAQK
jgi:hypothetical protein